MPTVIRCWIFLCPAQYRRKCFCPTRCRCTALALWMGRTKRCRPARPLLRRPICLISPLIRPFRGLDPIRSCTFNRWWCVRKWYRGKRTYWWRTPFVGHCSRYLNCSKSSVIMRTMRRRRAAAQRWRIFVCTWRMWSVRIRWPPFPSTIVSFCRRPISGNRMCCRSTRMPICWIPFSNIT